MGALGGWGLGFRPGPAGVGALGGWGSGFRPGPAGVGGGVRGLCPDLQGWAPTIPAAPPPYTHTHMQPTTFIALPPHPFGPEDAGHLVQHSHHLLAAATSSVPAQRIRGGQGGAHKWGQVGDAPVMGGECVWPAHICEG